MPAEDQPALIDVLREEGAKLDESQLPTADEVRRLLGALVHGLGEVVPAEQVESFRLPDREPVDENVAQAVEPGAPVAAQQASLSDDERDALARYRAERDTPSASTPLTGQDAPASADVPPAGWS